MKLISLIFSFKNEEKNIQELIDRVSKTLSQLKDRWNYEMIFVNDASTDKSEQILIELQNKYPITIINMSRTFGVGPCVLAGFKESKGEAIIYMDSDLQDPPELIKDLITEHEKGFDVVHTVRSKRLGEPWLKLFLTKIAYKVINFLSDVPLPVEAGDFKLISRTALDKILKQKEFRPYIRGLSVWVGFKQGFINYIREARHQGQTKFPLLSHGPINQFISGVTAYSLKPLYLAIIFGIFAFLFSLILMIYALFTKLSGLSVPGTSGILITVSFFSGVILFCIGIMGIYLARIFEEVRGRDSYIIKNIIKKN